MKRISAALAVAALAVAAAPAAAAADSGAPGAMLPGAPGTTFSGQPGSPASPQDSEADGTIALILAAALLFAAIGGPLFGAESRPAWRNVDRKPKFRMVGSMRPEDWPPSDFKR